MSHPILDVQLRSLEGEPVTLRRFEGQVLLIVNVASKCGFTPQYAGLQAVHERFQAQGLAVLGFPANDFAGQEPGAESEIAAFCSATYGVSFPMFEKLHVVGPEKHPLYRCLTAQAPMAVKQDELREKLAGFGQPAAPPGEVLWNFEKFLVSRCGEVVGRFSSLVPPDSDVVVAALERELSRRPVSEAQG